jgi:transcriptional regulator GlxA family with amidase domain
MGRKPHTVVAVVPDGFAPFELGVACEVFGLDRSELVDPWYRLLLAAVDPTPLRTKGDLFTLDTPYGIEALAEADTVLVPAWGSPPKAAAADLVEALRAADGRGARILSVCSGAFLLGHAGLLDGRRCTTHWMYTDLLAEMFPEAEVDPNVLYVVDDNVMTSAGTAAGIDLCLHVVRLDHGAEVANAVARRMVVPPHRDGGQAQYVQAPVADAPDSDRLGDTLTWAVEHLDEELPIELLARRANMSPRTFARRFRAVTGTTPHQWLLRQRVLLAQRLLETSDEAVELVATRCGFGSAAALRAHFGRQVGTSPLAYRRTFTCQALAG